MGRIIIVDYFSKFPEIARLTDTKKESVIRKLKSVFARYGIPQIIMSDNGPQFNNYMFKKFEKDWDFKHITSGPLHSKSNCLVERNVQTNENFIKKARQADENPFLALLNFRSTKIDGVESPAALPFGRDIRNKLPYTNSYLKPRNTKKLKLGIRSKRRGKLSKGVLFLHDNARPHTSCKTVSTIIKLGFEVLEHPAYSPDLAPSDYFLFGLLKKELKGKRFDSNEDVQKVVQDFFHTPSKSAYKKGIYKLPERWRRCIYRKPR
ncbi:K02A2.6-like [Cordylochernes scorpioides]|uniref:K02A2.6-like n=1 Tax=Cordylochernes scorpioides TaxID=51811 RepID=A0ABY6KW07_9ARAC|nr:K02A2.6-like [Cordylochernes scorpioides]